jgi:ABC-2 type transport system permease protein
VSARTTLATAARVLRQLRRDRRTVFLMIAVPVVLLTLVRFIINRPNRAFDQFGLPLVGIFPLVSMFMVTSIAVLRERLSGTLERLLTMPVARADILGGYGLAFALVACVQAGVLTAWSIGVLGLHTRGPVWLLFVLAVGNALLGMAIGLFLSAFAATEFQAVQFLPAFLLPQLLLCGLAAPRRAMAGPLQAVARVLPMTYAYEGIDAVRTKAGVPGEAFANLFVVLAVAVLALALGAATLRRRTA